jgi:hypothetical protein
LHQAVLGVDSLVRLVWMRLEEELILTPTDLVWHLGEFQVHVPYESIESVEPIPTSRLTIRGTPDLRVRAKEPIWSVNHPRLPNWWSTDGRPGAGEDLPLEERDLVIEIRPRDLEGFVAALFERVPGLRRVEPSTAGGEKPETP